MYRVASRSACRAAQNSLSPARTTVGRRFISTEPPHLRSRSWKSSTLRWGIAIAGIYYYNTSPVFADQPQHNLLNPNLDAVDESSDTSALDALTSRRSRNANKNAQALHSAADALSSENASTSVSGQLDLPTDPANAGAAELEEEADSEGAFNPETGEINWDCSCLGGMAHGPCGPEFREAFSCFVYSKEEPKGMECIDKFQGMRDCFQRHPDVYKDELMEDEEIDREVEAERQELAQQIAERRKADQVGERRLLEEPAPEPVMVNKKTPAQEPPTSPSNITRKSSSEPEGQTSVTKESFTDDNTIPNAAHDATDAVAPSDRKSST